MHPLQEQVDARMLAVWRSVQILRQGFVEAGQSRQAALRMAWTVHWGRPDSDEIDTILRESLYTPERHRFATEPIDFLPKVIVGE